MMDLGVKHFSLLIFLICAALPATIEGTASFGGGGMRFGFNPDTDSDENPDSDADTDASSEASSTTRPPLGFLGFGEGGMRFSFNTPAADNDDPALPGAPEVGTGDSLNIADNFGCCPSLDRETTDCGEDPEDKCFVDASCGAIKKCCSDGCRKVCMAPVKRCSNNKKWKKTIELRVRGKKVKCQKCSCDELYMKDTEKRGFLKAACSRRGQVAKNCCKLCEYNFNLGQHEPCDQ